MCLGGSERFFFIICLSSYRVHKSPIVALGQHEWKSQFRFGSMNEHDSRRQARGKMMEEEVNKLRFRCQLKSIDFHVMSNASTSPSVSFQYAGIRIGPVVRRDVMKASIMLEHKSE
jgi:hypothetical protein